MEPWIVLLFVPLFVGLFYRRKSQSNGFVIFFTFFVLFAFRAFRANTVGGDLVRYEPLYDRVGMASWSGVWVYLASGYEIGYIIYYKFLNTISHDFRLELIATSLLYTLGLLIFVFKKSKHPGLSLFIYITMYFYSATFNNERQSLSIVLLMLSTIFISSRSIWKFLLCILFATLFHTSSIVFIPAYYLYNVKISTKYWIIVICTGVIVFVMSSVIMNYVIGTIYSKYEDDDLMAGGGYTYFALLLIIALTNFFFYDRKERNNPEKRLWIHMLVFATVLQLLSFTNGYFYRAVILYSVAMIIYFPDAISTFKDKNMAIVARSLLIIFLMGIYIFYLSNDSLGLLPYKSIINWGI